MIVVRTYYMSLYRRRSNIKELIKFQAHPKSWEKGGLKTTVKRIVGSAHQKMISHHLNPTRMEEHGGLISLCSISMLIETESNPCCCLVLFHQDGPDSCEMNWRPSCRRRTRALRPRNPTLLVSNAPFHN